MISLLHEINDKINEAKKIAVKNPYKSLELSMDAYRMAKENNFKSEQGYSLISMSFSYRANSEISKMLDCSFKALEIFEAVNDPLGQIKALNLIGIAYFYSSMYEDSLKNLLKVSELLLKYKDNFLLSCVLNNIGEVYRESKVYGKAMEYYNKALKISMDNSYKLNIAAILGNIGEIYFLENKFLKALDNFNKSYKILINDSDMINLGEVENRLGKVHYAIGDCSTSEEYFLCSLKRLDNVNNKYYAIDVLVNLAKLNLEKDLGKSKNYYEKAMHYAEEINASKKLSEIYMYISQYYEKKEEYKMALEYYKKYSHVNEEIMTSNLGNKLEIMKIKLQYIKESDKFDNIKKMLEKEINVQKNELHIIKKTNEILEKKAYEDELTKIPNRRYINSYLNKLWNGSFKGEETIVLFMIDIDNFKKFNDYWGHTYGDQCLKKVAESLKKVQKDRDDVIGRYGGEEFIYIARNLNYDQALELGNYIRKEVEKLGLSYIYKNKSHTVTISMGGAIGKLSDLKCISNLLETSDKELYKAKDFGRNITLLKTI